MTLTHLFQILKGGPTSGNFGHEGRPGKHGGSAPGGGHGRIGISSYGSKLTGDIENYRLNKKLEKKKPEPKKDEEKLSKDTDFYNKDYVVKRVPDEVAQTLSNVLNISEEEAKVFVGKSFSYKDEKTGYGTSISEAYRSGTNEVTVGGTIHDTDGNKVGNFSRIIMGDKTVYHSVFQMEPEAQSSGFGGRFYRNVEESYKQVGIKSIYMEANLTVGGYAWARMGFSYQDKYSKQGIDSKFKKEYTARYGKPPPSIPQTAYEVAAYTGPDGHRLGKDVLLGESWNAIKNLSDDDLGYQVGQAYYASKGGK